MSNKEIAHEILEKLGPDGIRKEYESWDVRFQSTKPNGSGRLSCYAFGREEKNASAAVCVESSNGSLGQYLDSSSGEKHSFFYFASKVAGRFPSYADALEYYARRTGVAFIRRRRGRRRKGEKVAAALRAAAPRESPKKLEPLKPYYDDLTARDRSDYIAEWCHNKPGVSLNAVLATGAKPILWHGQECIAISGGLAEHGWQLDALVLYRLDGQKFPAFKSDKFDVPERRFHLISHPRKSLPSIAPACSDADFDAAEWCWLCEGFTDAAALAAHLPAGHAAGAVTNGANCFTDAMARTAAGKGRKVALCFDDDQAGANGTTKAIQSLQQAGARVWRVQLPFTDDERARGCKDVRDFINARGSVADLLSQLEGIPELPAVQQPAEQAGGKDDPGLTHSLAELICKEHHFARNKGGLLYRYIDGVYRGDGEDLVKRKVKSLLIAIGETENWSSRQAREVVEYIATDAPLLSETPPADAINVRNGLIDIATGELRPHTPDFISTTQLPIAFDANASCPAIEAFVAQIFPDDALPLAWEIPAYCMTPDISAQKAVLLLGKGGNGKSTWLALLRRFLGEDNICSTSLHSLEANRFSAADLFGKLACISADLPNAHLEGTSIFKAATGGDAIQAEYKHRGSFQYHSFAKLVFSANSPPITTDRSDGFFDRWLVVPFGRRIRGTDAERKQAELLAELSAPTEMSGLLNRALKALHELTERRCRFTQSVSTTNGLSQLQAASEPVKVFLDTRTVESRDSLMPKKTLLRIINKFLIEAGWKKTLTEESLSLQILKYRPDVDPRARQKFGDESKVRCFRGIRVIECDANSHDWIELNFKNGVRTECARCGKWAGNKPS